MNSAEQILEILDSSLNGLMVLSAVRDQNDQIIDFEWRLVNKKAAELIGRKDSDLLGKRWLKEVPGNWDRELFEGYVKVAEQGKSAVLEVRHPQGSSLKNWFQVQAVKMGDGIVATFLDITNLKLVEAELVRKERLLSEAQDLANIGSWSWNLTDKSVHWSENVRKIYEIKEADFQPSYAFFIENIVAEDRDRIEKTIQEAVNESRPYDITFRVQLVDKQKYLEARAIPKLDEKCTAYEYFGIIKDITLEKTQEMAFRKSERQSRRAEKVASSERMAKSIAHEIRNPLTNITLATEQLKSDNNQESNDLFLDMISRNSHRIEDLIKKLMDSARQSALAKNRHNINEILDSALALAMDRIRLRGVKINKDYQPEMCDILVDQEKVRIALLNIIINAIEATEDNGELHIETELTDDECIVRITDNGMGIEEDKLNHLFDPFYTDKKKGLGLGLTTTLNIINSHGANVEVESEVGKGTLFIISFKRD